MLSSAPRSTAAVTAAIAVAAATALTVVGTPATAAVAAAPVVRQTLAQATTGARVALPTWAPAPGDLVLVGVATQAWRKVPVAVRGNGLVFQRVAQVRNAQGVEMLDLFRAQGSAVPGSLSVDLPANTGAASVIAVRVSGAAVGANGADAVRSVAVEDGPTAAEGDNADMRATVESAAGDLVLGIGTHRTRRFIVPSGQTALASDVAAGSGGQRTAASSWSTSASATRTTIGAAKDLSGVDDWALAAVAVRSAGAGPVAETTTAPSPSPTASATPTAAPTASPTPVPSAPATATPTAGSTGSATAVRPYGPGSPWNTTIPADAPTHPDSATWMRAISDNGLPLTSDVDQYTIPVYAYDASTPRRTVKMSGYFSSYDNGDASRVGYGFAPSITGVPVPEAAVAGVGSDGQIVFWDPASQTEYSFWQFSRDAAGNYVATNGYRYHTGPEYQGRFADGLAGRGAGMPYLAGLVRRWELDRGSVDHALAFAYHAPSPQFVYPASKSDGASFGGVAGVDVPEGARLQLNPALTDADLAAYGLSPQARVIARALQRYGMYVVDNSGSSKVYVEDRRTAGWDSTMTRSILSGLPWSQFRVVA